MKRLMLYTAVALATLTALAVLWEFRFVALLFAVALFVAATVRPVVERLTRRGVPAGAAALLLYAAGFAGLLLVLFLLGELLLREFNVAVNLAVITYDQYYLGWQEGAAWQQLVTENLPVPFSQGVEGEAGVEQVLPAILNVTVGLGSVAAGLAVILAMSVYWSVDQSRFERLWLSTLPVARRMSARDTWREVESDIGRYLRNQIAQSVLIAICLALGGYALRLDYPLLLGLFGALAALVPYLGATATVVIALLAGWLESPAAGVAMALYTVFLLWALDRWLKPRLWPRERRSFLLTLLVMIPLVESFGLLGFVAAPPLALALEALVRLLYGAAISPKKPDVQFDQLAARLQELSAKIEAADEDELPPELRSLSQRLAALLAASRAETLTDETELAR